MSVIYNVYLEFDTSLLNIARNEYKFIRESFALIHESFALFRESFALIREKNNFFFSTKMTPIGFLRTVSARDLIFLMSNPSDKTLLWVPMLLTCDIGVWPPFVKALTLLIHVTFQQ